jgi:lipopolysaccharide/colanic/teichoic acid biosynthesis glycosyltransferase
MSRSHRLFDLAGAAGGLVGFGPVMLLIALAIWMDDGAPILFRQPRLGYRRRPFEILKFRTMRDGRVTRMGRLLRATGLDEIPQFLNILRGDMSAVGPRPLTEDDVVRLGWTPPACDVRWSTRPGLTGLAQLVHPPSAAAAFDLDCEYARAWRPRLDCELIAWSFAVNAFGKARVRRWIRARYGLRIDGSAPSPC